MRAPRALKRLVAALVFGAVLLTPVLAWAQTPVPGTTPEASKPWTYWLSFPLVLGAGGLFMLVALSYVRLSPRFYGREEVKLPKPPPQYAGVNAPAYPAPVVAQAPVPAPAPAVSPPAAPAPAAEAPPQPAPEPEPAPAPEPAAAAPAEPAPAPEPAAAAPAEPAPAPQPAPAAAPSGPVDPNVPKGGDAGTYQRVLEEQLAKGVDRRIAEGRAKSASIKAARPPGEGA